MPAARRLCSLLAALTLAACAQGSTTPTPVGYRGDDRDAAVPVADPLFGPVPTPDAPGATRPTEPPADAEHAPDAVFGDAEHRGPAPVVDDAAEPGDARPAPVPDSVPPDAERALAHPSAPSLLGLHDVELTAEGLEVALEAVGRGGHVMRVAYSTDFDWAPAEAEGAARAADRGLVPVLRVDYARPEASAYADGTPTAGASLPPPGRVGYCLARRGGPGDLGPSRDGGDHLDCYLAYLDDLLAAPGADRLHTFVIGNEPNIAAEARAFPGQVMPADWVATVYRAARARIRSHPGHAQDRVFLGAVSPGPAGAGGRTASGDDALVGLLGVLAPAEVDGLAVHAYGGWLLPADNGGEEALQVFERALYGQLSLIDALGHGHTPVMLTEFSALVHRPTDPDGPRKRALEVPRLARFITDAYRSIDAWNRAPERHNVLAALYFTLGNPGFPHEWLTPYRPGGTDAAGDARTNPWLAFRALADAGDLEAGDPARGGPCAAPPAGPSRCFPETDQCLPDLFARVFARDGDVPAFGFPLAPAACETDPVTGRQLFVQWLQRQRFEYHAENAASPSYVVELGQLGRHAALEAGFDVDDWEVCRPGTRRGDCECSGPPAPGDRGHWVCGEIAVYWRTHGRQFDGVAGARPDESLALHGYPLTREVTVEIAGVRRTVQYFERARLERHEENCGARDGAGRCTGPAYILPGLLGCSAAGFAPGSRRGC
jgi:hypothetical protein